MSKKLIFQAVAAFVLYVVISLILERDTSKDTVLRELAEGMVFGVVYGVFLRLSSHWRNRPDQKD